MQPSLDRGDSHWGSRFLDRLLRKEERPAGSERREAEVIAVASGKGGTGKSFLASNLSVALCRRGHQVTLVDCDLGLGNAHLLMGVNPRHTVQHLLASSMPIEDVVTPTEHGPSLLAGGSGISSLADLTDDNLACFASGLRRLAAVQDVLVLDAAAGISPQSLVTVLAAQQAIVVTNPEIAALTDAYALVKCLSRQQRRPSVHVVVNRVLAPGQGRATFDRLADVSLRFAGTRIHYLGSIPEDPSVGHRRLGQPPLVVSEPECMMALAIENLLRNMEAGIGLLGPRLLPEGRGVQDRILGTLSAGESS